MVAAGAERLVSTESAPALEAAVLDESAAILKQREVPTQSALLGFEWKPLYWAYVAIGAIVLYTLLKK